MISQHFSNRFPFWKAICQGRGFANVKGLTTLLDLGQTVSHAEETLDIDRAYLEIPALQNLTLAEILASRWRSLPVRESLETFQEFDDLRSVVDH